MWEWIQGRHPAPPMSLEVWVSSGDPDAEGLTRVALEALGRARGTPGRVRDSAFDLLAADALLTYACEAALATNDPKGVLLEIGQAVASSP